MGSVGAGAHRDRVGHELGVARQRERAHPARFRGIPRRRQVRESMHGEGGVRRRRRDAGREHRPGTLGLAPREQQLPGEPPDRRRRIARREQAGDPLPLHLWRLRELTRGVGQLRWRAHQRRGPLACRSLPVAGALVQGGELDPERAGPSQGAPPLHQHGARRVVAALVVQGHRPLAIGCLVARRRGGPASRHLPRAVGLVQTHVGPEQDPSQGRVTGAGRGGALRGGDQLRQPVEPRQHALQPEQRREIGGVRAQRREVNARRLPELTRALELEALTDGLAGRDPPGRDRERQTERQTGDAAIAVVH